jgi:hypothetical protein
METNYRNEITEYDIGFNFTLKREILFRINNQRKKILSDDLSIFVMNTLQKQLI